MHPRLYRLTEAHQRIDRALREELLRPAADLMRLTRLTALKLRVKRLMARLLRQSALA
jgi:hypothetical protein